MSHRIAIILAPLIILCILSWETRSQTAQCYTVVDSPLFRLLQTKSTTTSGTPIIESSRASPTVLSGYSQATLPKKLALAPIEIKYSDYLQKLKPQRRPPSGSSEYTYRELVYDKNCKNINDHNSNSENSFVKGLNKFTDLVEDQFIKMYAKLILPNSALNRKPADSGKITTLSGTSTSQLRTNTPNIGAIILNDRPSFWSSSMSSAFMYTTPPSIRIDWSCKASPVINQGLCGACYIVSALQSTFITLKIYNKNLLPLSIQQILSCAPNIPNVNSCVGGYFDTVYRYMQTNGVGRSIMYPYDTKAINEGVVSSCNTVLLDNANYKAAKTKIVSSAYIPNGDCAAMIDALKMRAIAVSIAVDGFQFYSSGIFTTVATLPNHGVTLVGYDPTNQYKIKNSWGTTWGMSGYAYIDQTTGVCDYAMYPVTGNQSDPMGPCCV